MTQRKPPGVSFETWVDRQITQAQERGDFAALPGAGRPLKNLDREETAYDWAVAKARREGVETAAMLPPGLRLRRERDELPQRADRLTSEAEVRALAEDYNARVEAFWRLPAESRWAPVPGLADVEALVAGWLAARPPPPPVPPPAPHAEPARRSRFLRLGLRSWRTPGRGGRAGVGGGSDDEEAAMTEVPGTDRDEARERVREETPLVPEDVEGNSDEARPQGDEGVTGDEAKPSPGSTDPVP